MIPKFLGTVNLQGVLDIFAPQFLRYKQHLFNLRGKDVEVVVKERSNKKSDRQRRYYFGVIVKLLCEETGYSLDEMHQLLKTLFLGYEKDEYSFVRSTESLTTKECEEFHENVRQWAHETFEFTIPLPNEVDF